MRPRGFDDLAAATEQRVAKFENAQVGPGSWALPDDSEQRLVGRPIGSRLRQDKRRRRGRARHPRVTVDQEMRSPSLGQVTSKGEEVLDVFSVTVFGAFSLLILATKAASVLPF